MKGHYKSEVMAFFLEDVKADYFVVQGSWGKGDKRVRNAMREKIEDGFNKEESFERLRSRLNDWYEQFSKTKEWDSEMKLWKPIR